jgi:antitoxin MazE
MKARIIRIGNSQGVRLPKPLLEQAGLPAEVELHAEAGRIIIEGARPPRAGWAEAAAAAQAAGDDALLDGPGATRFDAEEWEWR